MFSITVITPALLECKDVSMYRFYMRVCTVAQESIQTFVESIYEYIIY